MKTVSIVAALVFSGAALTAASAARVTSAEQNVVAKVPVSAWIVWGKNQSNARVPDMSVEGKKAVRITIPNAGGQPGDATVQSPIKAAIRQGDRLRMSVWLKTSASAPGAPGRAILKLKQAKPPYGNLAEQTVDVGPDWKQYVLDHVAAQDIPAGSTNVTVQLGLGQQTVDVGPASVAVVASGN